MCFDYAQHEHSPPNFLIPFSLTRGMMGKLLSLSLENNLIENNETEKKSGVTALVIGIVILLCCICLLVAGMAGYGYYTFAQMAPTLTRAGPIFPTEPVKPVPPAGNLPPDGGFDLE